MRKYSAYKDSGVEWIGEIPEHWEYVRLKLVSDIRPSNVDKKTKEEEKTVLLCNYVDVYRNDFITNDISFMQATASDVQIARLTLEKDDVIATKDSEDPKDIGVPALVKESFDSVVCGYHLTLIRSNPYYLRGDFLYWFVRSDRSNQYFYTEARGITRYAIGSNTFKNLKLALPPLDEQTQIANYLYQKTSEIDTLIAKKVQLIKLLEEERTAMISQAVTKGLDPNVPMKESGIDWLGKIPEHWEVARVKHFTKKIGSGVTPRGGAEVYQDAGVPLLRSQNIYFDGLKLDNVAFISNEIHDSMNNSKVLKGDVLLNITGGSIGRCYYLSDEYKEVNVNQHVCIIRPNSRISTKYLYLLISSEIGQNQIRICQQGGNREALNFEQLKVFPFALPSIQEQLKIIEVIDNKKEVMDHSVNKVTHEVNLLKEYKTALISEVVTGKIDIRQEVLN